MREEKHEVSWNLASQQSMFIGNLIQQSMTAYLAGNIGDWFWKLNGIREMIHHDLNPEELKDLDKLEKEISPCQNSWKKIVKLKLKGTKPDKEDIKNTREFPNKIRLYQRRLMEILKRQGYFPNKENKKKISF